MSADGAWRVMCFDSRGREKFESNDCFGNSCGQIRPFSTGGRLYPQGRTSPCSFFPVSLTPSSPSSSIIAKQDWLKRLLRGWRGWGCIVWGGVEEGSKNKEAEKRQRHPVDKCAHTKKNVWAKAQSSACSKNNSWKERNASTTSAVSLLCRHTQHWHRLVSKFYPVYVILVIPDRPPLK